MSASRLSVTQYAVLGLLAERPNHGFAISKELAADSEVGRVFTVRRPLVYRALDRLVDEGWAEPIGTEKEGGPTREVHGATRRGRARLRRWVNEPVEHVRDLRIEFLLKLTLLERAEASPLALVSAQFDALKSTLSALNDSNANAKDHVELWRRHNAVAATEFLSELEDKFKRS